jgi:hypothetical protein
LLGAAFFNARTIASRSLGCERCTTQQKETSVEINRMTPEDFQRFIAEARKHFRGEWDETAWEVAKPLIMRLRPSLAMGALHSYAAENGSDRSRFIYGVFRKHVDARQPGDEEWTAEQKRKAKIESEKVEKDLNRIEAERSWDRCRSTIASASVDERRSAVTWLMNRGWKIPVAEPLDRWPHSALLAVSDLIAGVPVRDVDGIEIDVREFYGRLPPPVGLPEAAPRATPVQSSDASERLGGPGNAVYRATAFDPLPAGELDEIPF